MRNPPLLLKTPQTLLSGYTEIEVEVSCRLSSPGQLLPGWMVLFRLLGKHCHEQSYSAVNSASDTTDLPGKMHPWCRSGMTVVGVTKSFLLGFEAAP